MIKNRYILIKSLPDAEVGDIYYANGSGSYLNMTKPSAKSWHKNVVEAHPEFWQEEEVVVVEPERIEVTDINTAAFSDHGNWYAFHIASNPGKPWPTITKEQFPAIKAAIEQVLNKPQSFSKQIDDYVNSATTPAPESRDWEVVAYNVNIGRNRIFKLVKGLKNLFREDGHFDSKGRGELEAHPLAEIHSVRRLSDNTVWTVGEHVGDNDSIHEFKIEGIHVVGSNDIKVTGFETSVFLSSLKKIPPQPLFVTNDDKGIFPGDSYWHIVSDWTPQMEVATESGRQQYKTRALQTFSTKEEADRHILMNGPSRLSVEDIIYIYKNTSTPSDFQEYIIKLAKSKQSKQ